MSDGCVGFTTYGDGHVREESGLDLSFLTPRELIGAQGVIVDEFVEDIDEETARKLWYPIQDGKEHDVYVVAPLLRHPGYVCAES